jgi:hypothetical protein
MGRVGNPHSLVIISIALLSVCGCKESGRIDYIDDSLAAPGKLTVVGSTSIAGGAIIKYTLPNDANLLGAKAVYERNGEICETSASRYIDTLVVNGFGTTEPQKVSLYSVGINEKLSEPVTIDITPLTPAIESVEIDIRAAFGGVAIMFTNESRAALAVELSRADSLGEFQPVRTFYTESSGGTLYQRGLDTLTSDYQVILRDRWNNKSEPVVRTLSPLPEAKLAKSGFSIYALAGDNTSIVSNIAAYAISNLWDGQVDVNTIYAGLYGTLPRSFTISLGCRAILSRMSVHARRRTVQYTYEYSDCPRLYEIYGCDNLPDADGSWDNWTLLGSFETVKPSGYEADGSVGTVTAADMDYFAIQGDEHEFLPTDEIPDPYVPVRYVRMRVLHTFLTYGMKDYSKPAGQLIFNELTFWGSIIK